MRITAPGTPGESWKHPFLANLWRKIRSKHVPDHDPGYLCAGPQLKTERFRTVTAFTENGCYHPNPFLEKFFLNKAIQNV